MLNKYARIIIFIALTILIIGLFYWTFFTPPEDVSQRIQRTLQEQEKRADLSFKDVTFEEVEGTVKYWQLQAKTALVNKSTGVATLQNSNGTFFKNG